MKINNIPATRREYWVLFAIFAVSIGCRLISTAGSSIIPGTGSMYYPLQVRCLLERGALGYSDMPLVFWFEAMVAKLIIVMSDLPVGQSIVLACRMVNVVVPSLIVLPVFFLVKSICKNKIHPVYLTVILGLSVLNPSVLVLFAIDFDKNAISMLFVFMAAYYLWEYIRLKSRRDAVMTVMSVLLTLFTHFGCFAALFVFLIILTITLGIFHFSRLTSWLKASDTRIVGAILMIALLFLLPVAVALFDHQRFLHLASFIGSPSLLFNHSLFLSMLHGNFIYDWPNMLYLVIINSFCVISIITWFRVRKCQKRTEEAYYLSVTLWLFCLSNPFINTEIYNRLLFISMIPLTISMIFIFRHSGEPVKITMATILSLLLALTVATSGPRGTFISKEEHAELTQIGKIIPKPATTIVLAQHRVEFWVSWTLRVKSGQVTGIKPQEYGKYSQVLYVSQKNNPFREMVPQDAVLIRIGKYFDLYRIH